MNTGYQANKYPFLLKGGVILNRKSFFTAISALGAGIILLFQSAELSEGIRRGLSMCSYAVIPALFPFIALSVFICRSSAADFFETIFRPVTKLLKLPACCGGALLAAVIGGYPAAAKCISDLVIEGKLSQSCAAKMLCYCVNAGPPFLIGAVGIAVFGDIKIGAMLFAAQAVSSVLIALMTSVFSKKEEETVVLKIPRPSNAVCVVDSIISAAESCFRMCAFIIIACGVFELLDESAPFSFFGESEAAKAILNGIFEVTSGCMACGNISGFSAVIIAGALASFSGISVMLQIAAVTDGSGISLTPFIFSRFVHAGITAAILKIFLIFSGETVASFAVKGSHIDAVLSASAPAAVSLLCMAALFLLSLVPPKSEKEPLFSQIRYKLSEIGSSKIK